ncbi:mitochondrial intermembrane space import and assembly protein 40-B [Parasteatoda tepidariorum]|uniref:mitochondrial intermembrane space import and assembly protein 40-B n=1 Tax=Parasteatoda tepidariorum TaxID=114398 RepID=UPI00077FCBD6|nr:mitochondrial intermembrane space import and assembly protein 40-B [Parasteatoda tepidariorum]
MSYCVSHGKDKVMFLTPEELKGPSSIKLPEDKEPRGLLQSNGDINWSCPCLGSMVVGPCNVEFRESLSCFHYSTAEPRGSDCLKQFRAMNDCMSQYPNLYKKDEDTDATLQSLEEEQFSRIDDTIQDKDVNGTSSKTDVTQK